MIACSWKGAQKSKLETNQQVGMTMPAIFCHVFAEAQVETCKNQTFIHEISFFWISVKPSSGYVAATASPNKQFSTHGSCMYAAKVRGVTQGPAIRQSCVDC